VVVAIRGVTTGGYLKQIREYELAEIKPELHTYRRILIQMTDEYEEAVERVTSFNENEFVDFHARRMVEMAGNIVMGYLLILDTNRDSKYWKSLEVFLKIARAENKSNAEVIRYSNVNDLGRFKVE
jgi:hypothetical protein